MTSHENQDRNSQDAKSKWDHRVTPDKDLIWEEYQHRHDLCWRLIFQLTYAVVIIAVVPYIKPDIAQLLKSWIVALPVIGVALTALGLLRMRRELHLLEVIREKHRYLQGLRLENGKNIGKETRFQGFSKEAKVYLICLLALGLANTYVVLFVYLPKLPLLQE